MSRQNIDRDIEPQPHEEPMSEEPVKTDGLTLLRKDFLPHQISKLPKPTKAQTDALRADYRVGRRCDVCGGWHQPDVVHLDYVGHAALTDRLLDADSLWNWEPVAVDQSGAPMVDKDGGMWIRLTVCGVTRLGYGDAQGKIGANATKERIGDALRNAAMRFGAALDLWHKGDLHLDEEPEDKKTVTQNHKDTPQIPETADEDHGVFYWTKDDKGILEDLVGQGKDLCQQVKLTEKQVKTWEERYRGQMAQGDEPQKVFQRIGESIRAMQEKLKEVNA